MEERWARQQKKHHNTVFAFLCVISFSFFYIVFGLATGRERSSSPDAPRHSIAQSTPEMREKMEVRENGKGA